jgi:putative ABC transport system permease protein
LSLPDADRVVTFWHAAPAKGLDEVNLADAAIAFYRERARGFEGIAGYEIDRFTISDGAHPDVLIGARVTVNYFDVLGRQALYGRTFLKEEGIVGAPDAAVLSHRLWQSHLGGNPDIVGRTIRINSRPVLVAGIMPPEFDFPKPSERADLGKPIQLWVPRSVNPDQFNSWNLSAIGRLRPGRTVEDARREIHALWRDFLVQQGSRLGDGGFGADTSTAMVTLHRRIAGSLQPPLIVLFASVGMLLLIACANVGSLFLMRATARRREFALRKTLGATRADLMTHVLSEIVLVSGCGAVAGLILALWGLRLASSASSALAPHAEALVLDWRVLMFATIALVLTVFICGLVPALRSIHADAGEVAHGSRGVTDSSSDRFNRLFVVVQIAFSLVLLVGGALLVQSLRNLLGVDVGFDRRYVVSAEIPALPSIRYSSDAAVTRFYEELLQRVRALPGVRVAALTQVVPFSGGGGGAPFTVEEHETGGGGVARDAWWRAVTQDYFSVMGIPLLHGRAFDVADTEEGSPVAVIDRKLAAMYWGPGDAVGKRIRIGNGPWMTIVGVVAAVKNRELDEETKPYVYQPLSQRARRGMSLVLRTSVDSSAMAAALRRVIADIDPEHPIFNVRALEDAVNETVAPRRLTAAAVSGFAATALVLALVGLYGVIALRVTAQKGTFAIRVALGALPYDIRLLVLGDALKLTGLGIGVGLVAAFALSRLLERLLFGVGLTDALPILAVVMLLTATAMGACYMPSRRAGKADPLTDLRCP